MEGYNQKDRPSNDTKKNRYKLNAHTWYQTKQNKRSWEDTKRKKVFKTIYFIGQTMERYKENINSEE